jgi:cytochrome c-type biogenesis protein CcmH/NrfG
LALAAGFTLLVNVLLAATLVWTEWLLPGVLWGGWLMVALLWTGSASVAYYEQRERAPDETEQDWFCDAQTYYLQGNWYEAETLLGLCLKRSARDVEARLLLATLKRRTGRLEEASEQLNQLDRQEASAHWRLEIRRERELIDREREEEGTAEDEPAVEAAA